MKTVVLFGAGQVGAMVSRLLGPGYAVSCFVDNDSEKWGSSLAGIPVLSPKEGLACDPDCFCLCALDEERSGQMGAQIREMGFGGEILRPQSLKVFDARAATMRLLAEQIHEENIPGDVAELGVYKGDFAILINAAFPKRIIHLFDTFDGFDARDVAIEAKERLSGAKEGDFGGTSRDIVDKRLLYREQARYYKGYFPDTFTLCRNRTFAFVSIDADLYAPTAAALPLFWDRLSPGGVLMIHDVNSTQFRGPGRAVKAFCRERNLLPVPICDLHGSVLLRKDLQDGKS